MKTWRPMKKQIFKVNRQRALSVKTMTEIARKVCDKHDRYTSITVETNAYHTGTLRIVYSLYIDGRGFLAFQTDLNKLYDTIEECMNAETPVQSET